jgi:glyceraldehyde 3-phosphate dehydrogenase
MHRVHLAFFYSLWHKEKIMRIAINGFGRIGRVFTRELAKRSTDHGLEIVAINDLTDAHTLAHLLKYDSVHRAFPGTVSSEGQHIIINGKTIPVYSEKNPDSLPWADVGVDVVLESTGFFRSKEKASQHLQAGARQVVISAPAEGSDIPSVVLGVNDRDFDFSAPVISNASCTTNNAAPMVYVLDRHWGVASGYITTVHSYTGDQRLHDAPHKDLRRARAAAQSIVPTSTGAAKAITRIFPHLEGKLGGCGIRVPVANGSITDLSIILNNDVDAQAINEAFAHHAATDLKGILCYETEPIVSTDIIGNPHSCIFDAALTSVEGKLVKVMGWYDNEAGYSNRLVDLMLRLASN